MAKMRKILSPVVDGKNVTVAQARAAWRELIREGKIPAPNPAPKRTASRRKTAAKAG
ncbi:MAG TPA: hypothetical protein VF266_16430 [Thermoanaerobaculia bacterium]